MKYLFSVYYSVLFMCLNEIGPIPGNIIQHFGTLILLYLSNYMNTFFLGEFANISWKILESGMNWQAHLDAANASLFYIDMPH